MNLIIIIPELLERKFEISKDYCLSIVNIGPLHGYEENVTASIFK
jgi:hypothetical protein